MSKTVEVKFFNSFLLKKAIVSLTEPALWCGDPANPAYYPAFPVEVDNSTSSVIDKDWYVEETRIYGGFNEDELDLGVRAYIIDDRQLEVSKNSLIYSGIFNSRTGVNQTNVFSVAEDITKSLDPRYGGIERLYAEDTNLTIFQESKVSSVLIDKDAIYTAEGRRDVTSTNLFLGDVRQYSGEYGIGKFPESFAFDGNRRYYVDAPNGLVMRLSNDGNTEISKYGMEQYFRDELDILSPNHKRYVVDVEWTIPWSTPTTTLTFSGDNISELDYGMSIEGIVGYPNLHIVNIGTESGGSVDVTINQSITVSTSPQPSSLSCVKLVKDKVIGGFDDRLGNYTLSIVYNPPSRDVSSNLISIPSIPEVPE